MYFNSGRKKHGTSVFRNPRLHSMCLFICLDLIFFFFYNETVLVSIGLS